MEMRKPHKSPSSEVYIPNALGALNHGIGGILPGDPRRAQRLSSDSFCGERVSPDRRRSRPAIAEWNIAHTGHVQQDILAGGSATIRSPNIADVNCCPSMPVSPSRDDAESCKPNTYKPQAIPGLLSSLAPP